MKEIPGLVRLLFPAKKARQNFFVPNKHPLLKSFPSRVHPCCLLASRPSGVTPRVKCWSNSVRSRESLTFHALFFPHISFLGENFPQYFLFLTQLVCLVGYEGEAKKKKKNILPFSLTSASKDAEKKKSKRKKGKKEKERSRKAKGK